MSLRTNRWFVLGGTGVGIIVILAAWYQRSCGIPSEEGNTDERGDAQVVTLVHTDANHATNGPINRKEMPEQKQSGVAAVDLPLPPLSSSPKEQTQRVLAVIESQATAWREVRSITARYQRTKMLCDEQTGEFRVHKVEKGDLTCVLGASPSRRMKVRVNNEQDGWAMVEEFEDDGRVSSLKFWAPTGQASGLAMPQPEQLRSFPVADMFEPRVRLNQRSIDDVETELNDGRVVVCSSTAEETERVFGGEPQFVVQELEGVFARQYLSKDTGEFRCLESLARGNDGSRLALVYQLYVQEDSAVAKFPSRIVRNFSLRTPQGKTMLGRDVIELKDLRINKEPQAEAFQVPFDARTADVKW